MATITTGVSHTTRKSKVASVSGCCCRRCSGPDFLCQRTAKGTQQVRAVLLPPSPPKRPGLELSRMILEHTATRRKKPSSLSERNHNVEVGVPCSMRPRGATVGKEGECVSDRGQREGKFLGKERGGVRAATKPQNAPQTHLSGTRKSTRLGGWLKCPGSLFLIGHSVASGLLKPRPRGRLPSSPS